MKLFFFDLDGSLLNSEKKITPETYKALEQWHAAGHRIAISSGRPAASVLMVIRELKLDVFSPYAIAFNGAQIKEYATGKDLWRKSLSPEDVKRTSSLAAERKIYCHAYDEDHILTPREGEELKFYTRVVKLPFRILPDFPDGMVMEPCKMLAIDLTEKKGIDELGRAAEAACEGRVCCVRSNPWYLEIFPSDAGKGAAVTALAAHLNVDIMDTYATGDAANDVSMLKAAGLGIAPANSDEYAKAAADAVSEKDNDHDYLAGFIKKEAV